MVSEGEAPEFPGGAGKMYKYFDRNFKRPNGDHAEGKIYVEFIVEEDGSISNATIKRGLEPACDEEALRVVRGMPKWKPSVRDGKPVKSRMTVPIVVH